MLWALGVLPFVATWLLGFSKLCVCMCVRAHVRYLGMFSKCLSCARGLFRTERPGSCPVQLFPLKVFSVWCLEYLNWNLLEGGWWAR